MGCCLESISWPWLLSLKYLLGCHYFSLLQCWLISLASPLKGQAFAPVCRCSPPTKGLECFSFVCLSCVCTVMATAGKAPLAPQVYCTPSVDRDSLPSSSCGPLPQAVDFGGGPLHSFLCPPGFPHTLSGVSVSCLLMSSP